MSEEKNKGKTRFEEFRLNGGEILNKVKEIIHEGNVRRIILKDEHGKTFMEIPLTVGVVGAIVAPILAAVGAVAALASNLTIVVGKEGSVENDSFAGGILDFPQYTRPREFRGLKVPQVLFSGDHKKIERWRRKKALEKTVRQRPDLVTHKTLVPEDRRLLEEILNERKSE